MFYAIIDVIGIFFLHPLIHHHPFHNEKRHHPRNLKSCFIFSTFWKFSFKGNSNCRIKGKVTTSCLSCSNILNFLCPMLFASTSVFSSHEINLHIYKLCFPSLNLSEKSEGLLFVLNITTFNEC